MMWLPWPRFFGAFHTHGSFSSVEISWPSMRSSALTTRTSSVICARIGNSGSRPVAPFFGSVTLTIGGVGVDEPNVSMISAYEFICEPPHEQLRAWNSPQRPDWFWNDLRDGPLDRYVIG